MEINKIQFQNLQANNSQQRDVLRNFGLQKDTVSFSSKQKKKPVSFIDMIKAFFAPKKMEKTHYASVNAGFEEHFYNKQDALITEVSLSNKQKKILDKKIKDFEKYKASLSSSELNELEKNKHGLLDFSIVDGLPDTDLKGYKNFLNRYESFKNGDYSGMTNEELSQLLYYTDTTDLISDGKIGSFAQGRTGDCWFLSMLGNYASTKEGEENIAKRISKPDENGTYTVTFDDPFNPAQKKEYKVTQQDLQDFDLSNEDTMFSSGDLDVRILEVATGKMLNEYLLSTEKYASRKDDEYIFNSFMDDKPLTEYSPSLIIAEGNPEKQLLVHKALGYKSNVVQYLARPQELNDYDMLVQYSSRAFIEDTNAKFYVLEMELVQENGVVQFKPVVKPTDYESLTDVVNQNGFKSSEMTVGSGQEEYSTDEKESRYISTGHAFNVMELNQDGSITLNDPYNSAFPHTISNEDFDRVFTRITHIPKE